ncbi:MAG: hypothetical protein CSB24_04630 [Deltaproteobacteria bacterium]|nr:MAG: hypothetical protein CSB24_04630 [Deltaproteobacteria bacterium]
MKTTAIKVEGIELIVPDFLVDLWPHHLRLDDFPSFCGAGSGLGDAIVPEKCWGLVLSPACFIHDISWLVCEASWAGFHQSNSMFVHNMLALNSRSRWLLKQLRAYRIVSYFNAVDTVGAHYFWADKKHARAADPLAIAGVRSRLDRLGITAT